MKQLKSLLNKKVVGADDKNCAIYFENNIKISFHQMETYIEKYENNELKNIKYYSPSYLL